MEVNNESRTHAHRCVLEGAFSRLESLSRVESRAVSHFVFIDALARRCNGRPWRPWLLILSTASLGGRGKFSHSFGTLRDSMLRELAGKHQAYSGLNFTGREC